MFPLNHNYLATAFLFRENRRRGTYGRTGCNTKCGPLSEGRTTVREEMTDEVLLSLTPTWLQCSADVDSAADACETAARDDE